MTELKAILFDKDGTLVDFNRTWRTTVDHLASEAADGDGRRAAELMVLAGYDPASGQFRPDSPVAAGTSADIVGLWYPSADAEHRRDMTARFDAIAVERSVAAAVPIDGVVEALSTLHAGGYRLGIVTNDSTLSAEATASRFAIAHLFDAIYGYDAVARPKPAPDAVVAFCDLTGLTSRQVAVIGDNRHDIDLARNAGAGLAVGVLSGNGTRESLEPHADAVIGSVADLPEWLEQRRAARPQ